MLINNALAFSLLNTQQEKKKNGADVCCSYGGVQRGEMQQRLLGGPGAVQMLCTSPAATHGSGLSLVCGRAGQVQGVLLAVQWV